MSKKLKAIESEILPNHKEAEIWVTPTNEDGSKEVKYWNRKKDEWSECGGGIPEQITLHMDCAINGEIGNYDIYIEDGLFRTWPNMAKHIKSMESTDNSCTIHLDGGISDILSIMCLYVHPINSDINCVCDRSNWDTSAYSRNGATFVVTTSFEGIEDIIDSSLHIFFIRYNENEHKEETFYTLTLICGHDEVSDPG